MFTNYLKIAYRTLLRYKGYTVTNILGLAVGIAATILILSYIEFEMSYDDFQKNAASVYRVSVVAKKEGNVEYDGAQFIAPLGPAMMKDMPEVQNYVRLRSPVVAYLSFGEQSLKVDGIVYTDSTFFDILSFPLVTGSPQQALKDPYSIVLTPGVAVALFGNDDPMGKIVKADGGESFHVTGIVQEPPPNSDIHFRALASFSTLYHQPNMYLGWNGGNQYVAYVQLRPNARPEDVDKKFPAFMWGYLNQQLASVGLRFDPYLQPLRDIHLHYNEGSTAVRANIYTFALVALFILVIACVNFINLTTARSAKRAKEVGVRKVLGADRRMLIRQFLTETLLLTLLASVVALFLAELAFPLYKDLLGEDIGAWSVFRATSVLNVLALIVVVGLIAGGYPAFYLSSLRAAQALKSGPVALGSRARLRSILITLQFAVSIALIVCTVIVASQLDFLKDQKLGFNKENIVVLPLIGDAARSKTDILKEELGQLPGVLSTAASSAVPISGFTSNGYFPEGHNTVMMIHVLDVDDDFLKTFNIEMAEGRSFSPDFTSDKSAYLINQTLARTLGWQNPIGKTIRRDGVHDVIGVVKDFNFATLHSPIEPLIITRSPEVGQFSDLSVKLNGANTASTMSAIQRAWERIVPSTPFSYWFLDEAFDHLYRTEERFETLFLAFSGLAIWIALMGLLSLASFATEERTKEIGVRKVFGASVMSITGLLSRDFLRWVVLANLLAWPVAYYFMMLWLRDFAYRIDITVWPFVFGGLVALLLGWLSVGYQTVRAALSNPTNALRYE
jgi:putative ABC transport system permease protein